MKWFSAVVLPLFLAVAAHGQPSADLVLYKTMTGSTSVVTITNFGPGTAPGPFTVVDAMPAPARFTGPPAAAPWSCTPALPSSNLTCTHPGPLAPGRSIVLKVRSSPETAASDFTSCASVNTQTSSDPDPANNRDCACVDVYRCRDVVIDLTTGSEDGANLAINTADRDWLYVPASGAPVASTTANWPWTPPAGSPGTFINPAAAPNGRASGSVAGGQHTYRNTFTLADAWASHQCRLTLRFGADNGVTFLLDGTALPNSTATATTSAAWAQLTTTTAALSGGTHTLTANVTNQGTGYTGLYVHGEVVCRCITLN